MSFPTELSNAIDGVTEIVAAHLNNLEAKVGTDNSAVPTSLDYVLKNPASINPGHKHSKLWASDGSLEAVTVDAAGMATFAGIPVGPGSNPTTDNQLARKAYVDLMLPLAGGTMAGNITMNNHKVTSLAAASGAGEALRYDEWIAAQDPGHKHSKLWAADGSPEAVTVDTAGNVGIGTTNPSEILHVNGGNLSAIRNELSIWMAGNSVGSETNWTMNAYYSSGWKYRLADEASRIQMINGITTFSSAAVGVADGALSWTDNITILQNGNVGIGTTNPGYILTCNGQPGANGYTTWTNYSDIRFKQDIKPLNDDILARVLKLNPVTFAYNDKNPWGEKPGERTLYGFVAQELQELFPDMVGEAKGPDGEKYLTTNLSNLTLYLVQAIKAQQAQIETLQAKLN